MTSLNYNESAEKAIRIAQNLALEKGHGEYYPAHLLKALLHYEIGLLDFLKSIHKDIEYLNDWADVRIDQIEKKISYSKQINGSASALASFEESEMVRIKLGLDFITPICMLISISKTNIGFNVDELQTFPITDHEILNIYLNDDNSKIPSIIKPEITNTGDGQKYIAKYTTNRIEQIKNEKLNPIVARESECRVIQEILCRRTKPNVILIGEAGVGKTAIIDGLSYDIHKNLVPERLKGAQIYELDLGMLAAGATYKGDIEDRLTQIIKEIKQFDKAILFIDEIHTLLDQRGSFGSGLANMLKPELAKGDITIIGATTIEEFRKLIEPEQAFSRRFEVLKIHEPDEVNCLKILESLKDKYETHYDILIDNEALNTCVTLSKRYLKNKRLPDSAIDLLDKTMSGLKIINDTSTLIINIIYRNFIALINNPDEANDVQQYKNILYQINNKLSPILLSKLEKPINNEALIKSEEFINHISKIFIKLNAILKSKIEKITSSDIVSVVSTQTNIPMGKIQSKEQEKLLNIEQFLKQRLVGQDHALKVISEAILESRSGLNKKGQPIGSFFLLGPTGTGKTELAKSIADFLFNNDKAMIRFDMSEFKEEHSAALLYGAPPGYIGYEDGGLLVNKIRENPYSVILFDEIEKAHPSIFDIFLQILDEGIIHDRLGKVGDFSNALILFTSNIGSEWISKYVNEQLKIPTSSQLLELMNNKFKPEFLARLTEIIPFTPITNENLVNILDIQLKELFNSLNALGITIEIDNQAKNFIAQHNFNEKYGARQLNSAIRNLLKKPLSQMIIKGNTKSGSCVSVYLKDGKLDFNIHENNRKNNTSLINQIN